MTSTYRWCSIREHWILFLEGEASAAGNAMFIKGVGEPTSLPLRRWSGVIMSCTAYTT
jgi:hypothetical protein